MTKIKMKTPISYYGGKQKLLPVILPLIPKHEIYTESYCGGCAVYFGKEPSKVEVINDVNNEVTNFYRVIQSRFNEFLAAINTTLHSRQAYNDAKVVYENSHLFDEVQRAVSFYILTNQGWGSKIGSWGYDINSNKTPLKYLNKKKQITDELSGRLDLTQIESNDAIKIINSRDTSETFHYVDPPYPNTNQGHYSNFSENDFKALLNTLENVKGKFLLSCFPIDMLYEYIDRNNWHILTFDMFKSVNKKRKTEVLVANYPIKHEKASSNALKRAA